MRKSLILILGVVCAGALMVACAMYDQEAESAPPPFECPTDVAEYPPLDSICVTVRAGGFLGEMMVRADSLVVDADSVFTGPIQYLHEAPDLIADAEGRVSLAVFGGMGESGHYVIADTISLNRCTGHEGYLRRIHVDGPERGPGNTGPPSITVTGIYDRLLSDSALVAQRYACVRCARIEVCGTAPQCD